MRRYVQPALVFLPLLLWWLWRPSRRPTKEATVKFYAVFANGMWLNMRRPGAEFELAPHCLTPVEGLACELAGRSGGEVVEFELQETRRYTPAWRETLPAVELVG